MISVKKQAARSFAAMRALDVTAAERSELRRAGVAENTVMALLGKDGFDSLLPHLLDHLSAISAYRLAMPAAELKLATNHLVDGAVQRLGSTPLHELRTTMERSGLIEHICELLEGELRGFLNYSQMLAHGAAMAEYVWWAHWGMSARAALPLRSRSAADELMVLIGQRLGLTG